VRTTTVGIDGEERVLLHGGCARACGAQLTSASAVRYGMSPALRSGWRRECASLGRAFEQLAYGH
jgi:hypothetical protein